MSSYILFFCNALLILYISVAYADTNGTTIAAAVPVVREATTVPASNVAGNDAVTTVVAPADNLTSVNKSDNKEEIEDVGWEFENSSIVDARRILHGKKVGLGKRPYMFSILNRTDGKPVAALNEPRCVISLTDRSCIRVYLQLTKESAKVHKYRGWLCGGVIVHASYVLTSAACVEDADHFYIVSGTTKFVDSFDYKNDNCVCKNRRKVIWKCIPKNYKFDFEDSIKWSSNDIAIVKVDKPFKFGVKEEGCEFATCPIAYNNVSKELEKSGTKGFISGWGTMGNFREGVYRATEIKAPKNAKCLQEAKVCIMDNEKCAKKWAQKFRGIIQQYMICTKDVMKQLSEICDKKYANCTDVETRRHLIEPNQTESSGNWSLDLGRHLRNPTDYAARRSSTHGGFCENDHGGPLIVKYKQKDYVIGVISACKIDPKSHSCHGPFLYTGIYCNRQFISCSINKDVEQSCRRVFRTGITHEEYNVDWTSVKEDDNEADGNEKAGSTENESRDESRDENKDDESTEVLRGRHKKEDADDVKEHREEKDKDDSEEVRPVIKKVKKKKSKKNKSAKKSKVVNVEKEIEKEKVAEVATYESTSDENINGPKDLN